MKYYMLLCVIVTSASIVASDDEPETQRFYDFIDSDGVTHVIDTQAPPAPAVDLSNSISKYFLFTRLNPKDGQSLDIGDIGSIRNSNFNPDVVTVVLTYGWRDNSNSTAMTTIRDSLLEESDVNVIIYEWSAVTKLGYGTATVSVPTLGAQVGRFVAYLVESTNVSYDNIHMIGHSLGAHLLCCAGSNLGGKIARITGLDPAGPLWYTNPNQFNASCGIYVEAIHTNAGGLGIEKVVADVDFFPNGGSTQPKCLTPTCPHSRSWELYAASVKYAFIGYKCSSFANMALNRCPGPTLVMGNNDIKKSGSGIYRLQTSGDYPYQTNSNSSGSILPV